MTGEARTAGANNETLTRHANKARIERTRDANKADQGKRQLVIAKQDSSLFYLGLSLKCDRQPRFVMPEQDWKSLRSALARGENDQSSLPTQIELTIFGS